MVLWKFFCVCCDGLFGDQIRPCHFMPEMIIIAVAAETTVDTLLMYSTTGINHHMLHGRSEVSNFFFDLEFKAGSKAVRSTAGREHLPQLPSLPFYSFSAVLIYLFNSSHQDSLLQIDKNPHPLFVLFWVQRQHIIWLCSISVMQWLLTELIPDDCCCLLIVKICKKAGSSIQNCILSSLQTMFRRCERDH